LPLLDEELRDQESAEHEKNIHANAAPVHVRDAGMMGHHGQYRECPQAVQTGPVT